MSDESQTVERASKQAPRSLAIISSSNSHAVRDYFEITRIEGDRVALRALSTGKFLSAVPDDLSASGKQIGENEILTMTSYSDGTVAFQFHNGMGFLSASSGEAPTLQRASTAGPAERFRIQEIDASNLPVDDRGGCSSAWTRTSQTGILWDDQTHAKILTNAIKSLRDFRHERADEFIKFWDKVGDFSRRVEDGLKDADYKYPWKGNHVPVVDAHTYHDHFYNPDERSPNPRRNYRGDRSSAATEGPRYFNLSVYQAMRIHAYEKANHTIAPKRWYLDAGYYLGLSLHFLTDLTQPMHSANFANAWGENGQYGTRFPNSNDKRHSLFEGYAEKRVARGDFDKYTPLSVDDIGTSDIPNAHWFFHETAVIAKNIFTSQLLGPMRHMNNWSSEADLPKEAVDKTLEVTLAVAHKAIARYLMYWNLCRQQTWDIDPNYWYRVLEPTQDYREWVGLHWGKYMRHKHEDGTDLMFVLFNPDGTWSLACKSYVGNLWVSPFGEYKGDASIPPGATRFRFVPHGRPGSGDNRLWIFENDKHEWAKEVMGINDQAILARWEPVEPATQLYRLQKMGRISDDDQKKISSRWPTTAKTWYGDVDQ